MGRHWTVRRVLLYLSNHIVAHIPIHWLRLFWYRRFISVGPSTTLMMGLKIREMGNISIGHHTNVNQDCLLDGREGKIEIGNYVDIAPEVMIWTLEHDPADPDFRTKHGDVVIGDFVWIASRAMIMPGASISEGAVVAAGSVVTKSVDPYVVVGGVPARPIGTRPRGQRPRQAYSAFLY